MKQQSLLYKTAKSMFIEQLNWSPVYFGIIFIMHMVLTYFHSYVEFTLNSFFGFSYYSTHIYMLIIGIVAGAYFLPFYVKHGVTRKYYFLGMLLSTLGLSVAITIITAILSLIESAILWILGLPWLPTNMLSVNSDYPWIILLFIYILNIFTYYLIGLLIAMGYHRFGWKIGFGFIALAILFTIVHGFLWENEVYQKYLNQFMTNPGDLSLFISILLTLLLNCLLLCIIRLSTRRVAIKP